MSNLYSPPSRNYPQELPDRWRFEDGTVRTDLQSLSDSDLLALGWNGPITMPENISDTSYYTHDYTWNSGTLSFDSVEVDEYEKKRRVNYQLFWDQLLETNAYTRIKTESSTTLSVNTTISEFIALFSDAKSGNANVTHIQQSLTDVLTAISFTSDELAQIQTAFTNSGMFAVYTLS